MEKELVEYDTELIFRGGFPSLKSLAELMHPFDFTHCLIFIDNPRMVDYSIENRYPAPIAAKFAGEYQVIFGPQNLASRNFTSTLEDGRIAFPCRNSKYFLLFKPSSQSKDICFRLNLAKFWRNTRPISCILQLGLFPPRYYYFPMHFGVSPDRNIFEFHLKLKPTIITFVHEFSSATPTAVTSDEIKSRFKAMIFDSPNSATVYVLMGIQIVPVKNKIFAEFNVESLELVRHQTHSGGRNCKFLTQLLIHITC